MKVGPGCPVQLVFQLCPDHNSTREGLAILPEKLISNSIRLRPYLPSFLWQKGANVPIFIASAAILHQLTFNTKYNGQSDAGNPQDDADEEDYHRRGV